MLLFNTLYGWAAVISLCLILGQLLLSIFLGEIDVDVDADGDVDFDASSLLSPKGIIHFICGSCWYLVLIKKPNIPFAWYDYLIAIAIGLAFMALMAGVYYLMHRLANEIKLETGEQLIGRSGTIYLVLDSDKYIIYITINGAMRELTVKSNSETLHKSGDIVIITSYESGIYYIN